MPRLLGGSHGNSEKTCSRTPRGGFFDRRNQNRDSEPSAKPPRHSDKPTNLEILSFVIGPRCLASNLDGLGPAVRQAELKKKTYSLTPRGGFLDGRNQNRDSEPSAKPPRHSDKPTNLEMLSFVPAQPRSWEKEPLLHLPNRDHGSPAQAKFKRNVCTDSPRWIL